MVTPSDLYSKGGGTWPPGAIYGAIVIGPTSTIIDNVGSGISASVPEPGSLLLFGSFVLGAAARRRR